MANMGDIELQEKYLAKPRFDIFREECLPDIQPYSVLDQEGKPLHEVSVSKNTLVSLYRQMIFGREFDERATNMGILHEIGAYAPHRGQEATQVGMISALEPTDWFVPMYRDTCALMARGLPSWKILQYFSGDERGLQFPRELRILPFAIPVASQLLHADGLALANLLSRRQDVVLTTTGDGGTSKGDFHEALNFAGIFHLPVVFGIENNQYAISMPRSSQTASKTIAQKSLSYGIEGALVDGNDVLAVSEVMQHAVSQAREGHPFLVECQTYRTSYHSTAELASHRLRSENELEYWKARDPIKRLERYLRNERILSESEVSSIQQQVADQVRRDVEHFRAISPPDPTDIFRYMYQNPTPRLIKQARQVLGANAFSSDNDKTKQSTSELLVGGAQRELNLRNAINYALEQELQLNPRLVLFGEDVGKNGGVFQVTRGLQQKFGDRVFDTPLAESCIAGLFVGLSIGGFIPVAEFQFDGFTYPAFDQIVNHIARFRNRTRGAFPLRGVIRFPFGGGIHALEHHSDSPETYFVHTPGLKVVVPSTPTDAKGLLSAALQSEDPVIFMEPKKLYDAPKTLVPEERFTLPIGKGKRLSEGFDVTVVTYGSLVYQVLEAVQGHSADVIDLRTLSPIDFDLVIESVEKTGRLVIVHEAPQTLGLGAEIAATLAEEVLLHLRAPIRRVSGHDTIDPLAKLEDYYYPSVNRIANAIREVSEF
jgi:2-oxoisovalerate dehydrogenase E1 component